MSSFEEIELFRAFVEIFSIPQSVKEVLVTLVLILIINAVGFIFLGHYSYPKHFDENNLGKSNVSHRLLEYANFLCYTLFLLFFFLGILMQIVFLIQSGYKCF